MLPPRRHKHLFEENKNKGGWLLRYLHRYGGGMCDADNLGIEKGELGATSLYVLTLRLI